MKYRQLDMSLLDTLPVAEPVQVHQVTEQPTTTEVTRDRQTFPSLLIVSEQSRKTKPRQYTDWTAASPKINRLEGMKETKNKMLNLSTHFLLSFQPSI